MGAVEFLGVCKIKSSYKNVVLGKTNKPLSRPT